VRDSAFQTKTIRLLPQEDLIIDKACAAMKHIDRSTLMTSASVFHAHRLGIDFSYEPPPRLQKSWPYIPLRGDEATGVRLTITVDIGAEELIQRAAYHVHTTEPLFIIGSTLAYIGRLQRCFTGSARATPEEAAEIKKKLDAIKLPAQYEYRRRSKG
jgi:hypothetical protein